MHHAVLCCALGTRAVTLWHDPSVGQLGYGRRAPHEWRWIVGIVPIILVGFSGAKPCGAVVRYWVHEKFILAIIIALGTHSALADAPVPLLWKVSDADNSLYLLGSFHMLKPTDYPVAQSVEAAFEDSKQVYFELSPQEMSDSALGESWHWQASAPMAPSCSKACQPKLGARQTIRSYTKNEGLNRGRNRTWLPKLEALLGDNAKDTILVVVGAMHLAGKDGVVKMLADKGYKVERLK